MFVNEWNNLRVEELCEKHPAYKGRIATFVTTGAEMNGDLIKCFSNGRIGSEGKVYGFLSACIANHQSLLVGALNSLLLQSSYFISGFTLTKHNYEYISVIHKIISEILKDVDWQQIETKHLYNIKSIVKFLEDLPEGDNRKEFIEGFKGIGSQKNIIEYIKDDELNEKYPSFYADYSCLNALSHPNHYTLLQEKFPFISVSKMEYLTSLLELLQRILKNNLKELSNKIKN